MQPRDDDNENSQEDGEETAEKKGSGPAGKRWSVISTRLDVLVIVVLVALSWLVSKLERLDIGGVLFNVEVTALLLLIIVGSIVFARRKQRQVVKEFKLVCKNCGHSPRGFDIRDTELMKECMECHEPINR